MRCILYIHSTNDDLFHRLETVHFFRLFTGEGDRRTRAEVIQNPEASRLEYCPDCHLAQISLRRGAGEHVLHCDGSLRACHNQALIKNAQLQDIVNYSCLCPLHFVMLITNAKPCQNSV
jgi:hypothetical protein